MIRQAFARRAQATINTAGPLRNITQHAATTPSSTHHAQSSLATLPDPSTFPLYRPPPPEPEDEFSEKELSALNIPLDAKGLPSKAAIERAIKNRITDKAIENVPEFTEEALRDFYSAVVRSAAPEKKETYPMIEGPEPHRTTAAQRQMLLSGLEERLKAPGQDVEEGHGAGTSLLPAVPPETPRHIVLTAALLRMVPEQTQGVSIPLGIVKQSEWQALFDTFVARSDGAGAEVLLSTMERHGVVPSAAQLESVIELYAKRGDTAEVGRLLADIENVGGEISDHHRDMLVSSYLHGPNASAESAIALLTASEQQSRPFPQSSYGVVLSHLITPGPTHQPNSRTRALAWDLFGHMRYAAHPNPTREVFSMMISACGATNNPQPERARDLWVEMTESAGLEPRREEYTAIISALGSTKDNYLEAYELLRQMLARHEEATMIPFGEGDGTPASSDWVPSMRTFTALLEGTKRAGDLERARWVLSEVVDLSRTAGDRAEGPDDEMLAGVFQTYAAWKPRVTRRDVSRAAGRTAKSADAEETDVDVEAVGVTDSNQSGPNALVEAEEDDNTVTSPQTSAEALHEATLLFEQVVHDALAARTARQSGSIISVRDYPFARATLSAPLINSYLAVHLAHAPTLAAARAVYKETWAALARAQGSNTNPKAKFSPLPVENGWSYLMVLDRCARGKLSRDDRATAAAWGEEIWEAYFSYAETAELSLESLSYNHDIAPDALTRQRYLLGMSERQIERTWSKALHLRALHEDLDGALSLLRSFAAKYPPRDILDTYSPALGPQFKVRLSDPTSTPEVAVPPHMLFGDMSLLHEKLVRDERFEDLKYVKWIASAYKFSLAKRRKWRVKGVGVARERRKEREKEIRALEEGLERELLEAPEETVGDDRQ